MAISSLDYNTADIANNPALFAEYLIDSCKKGVLLSFLARRRRCVIDLLNVLWQCKKHWDVKACRFFYRAEGILHWMDRNKELWRRCEPRLRQSAEYHNWRVNCLNRDNWQCQECKGKENLHVHHIKHYKDYPSLRIDINNGITLCKMCHKKAHRILT